MWPAAVLYKDSMTALPTPSSRWVFLTLLGMLTFSPIGASAGMTPEEVKAFNINKALATDSELRGVQYKGSPEAQFDLAVCYHDGVGVAKDFVQAVAWWRKAALAGHSPSQFYLALKYESGEGLAKDYEQAVYWYRKAALGGLVEASNNLGRCYAFGVGVTKDKIEAYAHYNIAGATDEIARRNLALLEKSMTMEEVAAGQTRTKALLREVGPKAASGSAIASTEESVKEEPRTKGLIGKSAHWLADKGRWLGTHFWIEIAFSALLVGVIFGGMMGASNARSDKKTGK